jgi:hypothetical protein
LLLFLGRRFHLLIPVVLLLMLLLMLLLLMLLLRHLIFVVFLQPTSGREERAI